MKVEDIKFKAKSILDGAWVQGDLIHKEDGKIAILRNGFNVSDVDPSTVCQYTGLKDCEGNELYEHDVIKNYPFIPSEIVWFEELSGYYLTHANGKIYEKPLGYYLSLGKFIVVGNKFDRRNSV
jgi:hypothetical protein